MRRFEAKYFPKVKAVIKAEVSHVAGMVEHEGINAAMHYVHQHIHSKGLPGIVKELYEEVGGRFARRQWMNFNEQKRVARKELQQKKFGFNDQWVQFIIDYLYQHLLDKITFAVAQSTRDVLLTVLGKALNEGWGLARTVTELEDLPLSDTQAARIVRTEVTRAANTGVMAAGSTFEFQQTKEWIAAKDTRTRGNPFNGSDDHASHWALDGQRIDEEDVFVDPRNGDHLRFPGDPNASAESTINCRCNVALVAKVDENGRLIPKRKSTAVIFPNQRRQHPTFTI